MIIILSIITIVNNQNLIHSKPAKNCQEEIFKFFHLKKGTAKRAANKRFLSHGEKY